MMRPLPWELVQAEVAYRREQTKKSARDPERYHRPRRGGLRPRSKDRLSRARSWQGLVADLQRRPAPTQPC
jgi:hypothetical protein